MKRISWDAKLGAVLILLTDKTNWSKGNYTKVREFFRNRHYKIDETRVDLEHLVFDIERAYGILLTQWIDYMEYPQNEYPYLFSFALRTNPFDANASAIVS